MVGRLQNSGRPSFGSTHGLPQPFSHLKNPKFSIHLGDFLGQPAVKHSTGDWLLHLQPYNHWSSVNMYPYPKTASMVTMVAMVGNSVGKSAKKSVAKFWSTSWSLQTLHKTPLKNQTWLQQHMCKRHDRYGMSWEIWDQIYDFGSADLIEFCLP